MFWALQLDSISFRVREGGEKTVLCSIGTFGFFVCMIIFLGKKSTKEILCW